MAVSDLSHKRIPWRDEAEFPVRLSCASCPNPFFTCMSIKQHVHGSQHLRLMVFSSRGVEAVVTAASIVFSLRDSAEARPVSSNMKCSMRNCGLDRIELGSICAGFGRFFMQSKFRHEMFHTGAAVSIALTFFYNVIFCDVQTFLCGRKWLLFFPKKTFRYRNQPKIWRCFASNI